MWKKTIEHVINCFLTIYTYTYQFYLVTNSVFSNVFRDFGIIHMETKKNMVIYKNYFTHVVQKSKISMYCKNSKKAEGQNITVHYSLLYIGSYLHNSHLIFAI